MKRHITVMKSPVKRTIEPRDEIASNKSHFPNPTRVRMALALVMACVSQPTIAATFSNGTPLLTPRGSHTATLLSDGKLLIAGVK